MSISELEMPFLSPLYDPRWAIEKMQLFPQLLPVRLFVLLYPLWSVEVKGKQKQDQSHDLLERYLLRALLEGKFTKASELASFFKVKINLIERVLRSLIAMEYVRTNEGSLFVTALGQSSLEDGTKDLSLETKRHLYFDGFGLKPLPSQHYYRNLRLLSEAEAQEQVDQPSKGYQIWRLFSTRSWLPQALERLEARSDRNDYHLPSNLYDLEVTQVVRAYLPLYVIEGQNGSGRIHYCIFSRVQDLHDSFFDEIINHSPEIFYPLRLEKLVDPMFFWSEWMKQHRLMDLPLQRLSSGILRLSVPKEYLRGKKAFLPVTSIGSYQIEQGYFLHIWSEDEQVRRDAALDRVLMVIQHRAGATTVQNLYALLHYYARELQIERPDLDALYRYASETSRAHLLGKPSILEEDRSETVL